MQCNRPIAFNPINQVQRMQYSIVSNIDGSCNWDHIVVGKAGVDSSIGSIKECHNSYLGGDCWISSVRGWVSHRLWMESMLDL
jgi:hypothetical protein